MTSWVYYYMRIQVLRGGLSAIYSARRLAALNIEFIHIRAPRTLVNKTHARTECCTQELVEYTSASCNYASLDNRMKDGQYIVKVRDDFY